MPTKQRNRRRTENTSEKIEILLSAVEILNSSVQELLDAVESLISGATVHDYYAEAVPETLEEAEEDDEVEKNEDIH